MFALLFQGTQAWSAVSLLSLKKLNTVYMRVLRRIAAKLRFDSSCSMTDQQLRVLLNMLAIEMLIAQLRLGYLRQVLTSPVPQLRALLAVRDKEGQLLPWVQLVLSNLRLLKSHVPFKFSEPTDPFENLLRVDTSHYKYPGAVGSSWFVVLTPRFLFWTSRILPVCFSLARVLLSRVLANRYSAELFLPTCSGHAPSQSPRPSPFHWSVHWP